MYWLNSICWVGFQLPLNESIEADSDLVRAEVGQSILTKVERVNTGIGLWDYFDFFFVFCFHCFANLPVVLLDQVHI